MLPGSSFGYLSWTIGNGEGSSRTKGLVRRAASTIDNSGGRGLQRRLTDRQLTAHLLEHLFCGVRIPPIGLALEVLLQRFGDSRRRRMILRIQIERFPVVGIGFGGIQANDLVPGFYRIVCGVSAGTSSGHVVVITTGVERIQLNRRGEFGNGVLQVVSLAAGPRQVVVIAGEVGPQFDSLEVSALGLVGLSLAKIGVAENSPSQINIWSHVCGLLRKGDGLLPIASLAGRTGHHQLFTQAFDSGDALLDVAVFPLQFALAFGLALLPAVPGWRQIINYGDVAGGGSAVVYVASCRRQDNIVNVIVVGIADMVGKVTSHLQVSTHLVCAVALGGNGDVVEARLDS